MSSFLGLDQRVAEKVKAAHKELLTKKKPHIIAFLDGDEVRVIIAGRMEDRREVLKAIKADKGWTEVEK